MCEHATSCERCVSLGHRCYVWPWPRPPPGSQRLPKCLQCARSKQSCSNAPTVGRWLNIPAGLDADNEPGTPASYSAVDPYINWSFQAVGDRFPAASPSGDSRIVDSMLRPHVEASPRSRGSTADPSSHTLPSPLRPSPSMSRQPSLAPPGSPSPVRGGPVSSSQFQLAPATTWPTRDSVGPPDNFSFSRSVSRSRPPVTPPRPAVSATPRDPVSPPLRARFRSITNDEQALSAQRVLMDIRYRRAAQLEMERTATDRTAAMLTALRPIWLACRSQIEQLHLTVDNVRASMEDDEFLVSLLREYDSGNPNSRAVDRTTLTGGDDREAVRELSNAVGRLSPLLADSVGSLEATRRSISSSSFASRGLGGSSSRGRGEAGSPARRGSKS